MALTKKAKRKSNDRSDKVTKYKVTAAAATLFRVSCPFVVV